MTARDLPFDRAAPAALRRVGGSRARVLLPCNMSGAGGAGWHGERIKTSWGLVGREEGGVGVSGIDSRMVVQFTEGPFQGREQS